MIFTQPLLRRRQRIQLPTSDVFVQIVATEEDLDAVFTLWTAYASEHFEENLSYDRWGPGVPVPYDDEAATSEIPTQLVDPSLAVRQHLADIIAHPHAFALLAVAHNDSAGFLTASVGASPTGETREGRIDTLYTAPKYRRHGIGSLLVSTAVTHLRQQGASIFRAEAHPTWKGALRFWNHQPHWKHDARTYRCYD